MEKLKSRTAWRAEELVRRAVLGCSRVEEPVEFWNGNSILR
jgi:hypothetical protein